LQNCVGSGSHTPPVEVEALVAKIYKYVQVYTASVTELQRYCDESYTEYRTVPQHVNTRFLSFLSAVGRRIEIYEHLNTSFVSRPILNFFQNESSKFWLLFMHVILQHMERRHISTSEGDNKGQQQQEEDHSGREGSLRLVIYFKEEV
jgi:hypothetical protein